MFAAMWMAGAGLLAAGANPALRLRYMLIITRHGVRSPTWNTHRLNQFSTRPGRQWSIPLGNLAFHGRALMLLMVTYYRGWLSGKGSWPVYGRSLITIHRLAAKQTALEQLSRGVF